MPAPVASLQVRLVSVLLSLLALSAETAAAPDTAECPPVVFIKRHHFDRPFGLGSMIGWDIYNKAGGGIYIYDPARPDDGLREIFRRDDGIIFDMSLSFDARNLLFAWRQCTKTKTRMGPLTVSHCLDADTIAHVLEDSTPAGSAQKPNHSFWPHRGTREWIRVDLPRPQNLSEISLYWFDDQPTGGCKVPQSWNLYYKSAETWHPVQNISHLPTAKDKWHRVTFSPVHAAALRIGVQCFPDKSAGIQRLLIGTPEQHTEILRATHDDIRSDCFHIYEIGIDGKNFRQITTGPYQDIHPFYLPSGRIGFISTRVRAYVMCQPGAACALYTMEPDGSDIQRIHFGTLADHSPYVLNSGAILFTRWEYQDKDLTYLQGLWTINPDGTRVQLFYGNTIFEPAVIWQAKPIPNTSEVLCTLAPHHGNPVGAVGIIDRFKGIEDPLAITNLTPEIDYNPVRNARGPGDIQYQVAYRDPHAVNDNLFVVSHGGGPDRYRLFLMDRSGGKTLLYEDSDISCFNPVPLVPRETPHQYSSQPYAQSPEGTFFLADVYQGLVGVPQGAVKALRVMTVPPKPCNMRGQRAYDMDPLMSRGTYYAKKCLGTVPVDKNGSAYFKAPAGVELYFQALDADGKELCRMGSITQLIPGETQSCIGCHESRFTAPPTASISIPKSEPLDITAPPWGDAWIDFARHVQPVFTRYCASCHSGPDPDAGLDLSADKTRFFNMAYDHLTQKRLVNFHWLLDEALVRNFRPLESGSRVSKLTEYLENGHGHVDVPDSNRRVVYAWIEANVPYYGTYDHTRPGTPGSRDACTGTEWFARFNKVYHSRCASCHGKDFYTTNEPIHHTWINLTNPQYSRALNAPLKKTAGGLQLCKPKEGKSPAFFSDSQDRDYTEMLSAIMEGKRQLYANPRVDMPNARPLRYPTNHAGPFTGFAGP